MAATKPRRSMLWSLLAVVGSSALLFGCQKVGQEIDEEAVVAGDLAPAGEPPSLDELRALPYSGYSPAGEDRDKAGVVLLDRERSQPGYNLTTHRSLCLAELLSATGRALGRWTLPGCKQWSNSRLLEDGDLLVVGMDDAPLDQPLEARYVARIAWDGRLRWKRRLAAHHDIAPVPGERLLALTAAYAKAPPQIDGGRLYDNRLSLLDAEGKLIEARSVFELFDSADGGFDFQQVAAKETQDGHVAVDLFHLNSVQWNPFPELAERSALYSADHLLVCSRHQDVVAVIDWKSSELVWSWGRGELSGPHDASWLPSGNLLVFDNGIERGWSRVVEVDPASEKIVWQYRADEPESFFTLSRGSAQRLANGNTLIAESDRGHAFEVSEGGEMVWEYFSPYFNQRDERATLVRMRRHEPALIDRLRAELGAPSLAPAPDAAPQATSETTQ